ISKSADERVSVIPDFIANCGMARAFSYFMQDNCQMHDIAIFTAVSETIKQSLLKTFKKSNAKTNISKTAFEIALEQLI
ncbi:MAG: amino acid dehydrogenase, partial [Bacteroidota bacterium]|nr:amino acid dehydrogenase [Bacteroidota bacterium]